MKLQRFSIFSHHILIIAALLPLLLFLGVASASAAPQKFRHVPSRAARTQINAAPLSETPVPPMPEEVQLSASEIFDTIRALPAPIDFTYSSMLAPWVNTGYRSLRQRSITLPAPDFSFPTIVAEAPLDSAALDIAEIDAADSEALYEWKAIEEKEPAANVTEFVMPEWLARTADNVSRTRDIQHWLMTFRPSTAEYIYWDLPEPPVLPNDPGFAAYLQRLQIPNLEVGKEAIQVEEIQRRHWLHIFNAGLHFSQAYVSSNWYQGGNNYLALLINFLWDVNLNQVYHPNLLFQNTISYKLGLNSNPRHQLHKYNISEDIFQWNLKAGVKAFRKWFYSFTLQFKTQMLVNYKNDSYVRTASFLAPGDLNLGLGMTYSTANKKNTLKFNASISPISYNLKTCIDRKIDPTQFQIPAGKRFNNEIGSTAELTLDWKWASNISYKSRLFFFSNYKYFLGDWENTVSFNINKFLSTQIYVHLRYDTSSEISSHRWRHLMLKEILSFGFSYAFSTK